MSAMDIYVPLPGNNHIPPANDHVPAAQHWTFALRSPQFQEIARVIDGLGYQTITVSEHFAMPYEEVPRLGPFWMHAMTTMAFLAGATERVRLDTTVLVLPYHRPLDFAKAVSTLDLLSGGRLDVSIGVGHAEREFESLGVPFADRGAVTDEILEACKELWTAEEPVHHGRFFHIEGLAFEPKPVQRPWPPIYVGGNSKPALRRAARHDGWQPNPTTFSMAEMPPCVDYIKQQRAEYLKEDPSLAQREFKITWVGTLGIAEIPHFAEASPAQLAAYRDQVLERMEVLRGYEVSTMPLPMVDVRSLDEYLDYLRWYAEELLGR